MSINSQISVSDLFSGNLTGDALSHMILSTGLVDGITLVNIQGFNPDVDTGGRENISDAGGVMTFPTVASPVNINYAGTGTFDVLITGLDSNFDKQVEIVNFTTGATASTLDFIRINEMIILTPDVRDAIVIFDIGGDTIIHIVEETAIKRSMNWTVPNGHQAIVSHTFAAVGKNKDCTLFFRFRIDTPAGYNDLVGSRFPLYQRNIDVPFNNAFINTLAPAKTDILLECSTENNNTEVSAGNSIIEIRDDVLAKLVSRIKI